MSTSKNLASKLRLIRPSLTIHSQRHCRRCFATTSSEEQWPQRTPLGGYYESILNNPIQYSFVKKPEEPPKSADLEVQPTPSPSQNSQDQKSKTPLNTSVSFDTSPPTPPPPTTAQEKARIIFGSRLLGPAEQEDRLATKKAQSTYVAGVLIPPRPEEPDNCCMSGCVNCVWDLFREDLEEWTAQKSEADERLKATGGSADADGGGSETSWPVEVKEKKIAKDMWDEDAFSNVPVGIREFMKIEKRLREKHEKAGTIGGRFTIKAAVIANFVKIRDHVMKSIRYYREQIMDYDDDTIWRLQLGISNSRIQEIGIEYSCQGSHIYSKR
ncbi:hypothetical protein PT974_03727 [Cladobotryum mycophilum]|uniref:Oxidoreductase-like domain-containing protein n=1 Tax=Cladobotryum mycophilum TaxID=491253 RepID=A0ABR0ST33_9HYPO